MHSKSTLINDLKSSGLNPKGTVLVHSSMKAIGQVEGGADTILAGLCDFMSEGLLLLPTHTWHEDNLKDNTFDVRKEHSCVGLLTDLFRQRPDVIRSMHPSHSVAAIGHRAKDYTDRDMALIRSQGFVTPCPKEGCFGSLYEENSQILFLGVPLTTNTFIHSIEEWLEIPDRLKETPRRIKLIDVEGNISYTNLISHYSSQGDISKNYGKVERALLHKGIAHIRTIGDAKCYIITVRAMTDLIIKFLKKDPDLFNDKREVPESWYLKR